MTVNAANITGQKFNDLNRDGNFSVTEPLLPGWNITLYYAVNGTYTGKSAITDSNGQYTIESVNPSYSYYVQEDLTKHPGWYNSTKRPVSQYADFTTGVCWNETLIIGCDNCLNNRMPPPRVLFGAESRFGDNAAGSSGGGSNNELEVMYPIGQVYNLGNTKTYGEAHLVWGNGTVYNFNLTYFQNGTVSYRVYNTSLAFSHTVSGNFFGILGPQQPDHRTSLNYPFNDIVIRTLSTHDDSSVTVSDLQLTGPNGITYAIQNSTVFASHTQGIERENLFIRAQEIMNGIGGGNINNGFTLTGIQVMTYDVNAKPGQKPQPYELLYDIYVGNQICPANNNLFINFGNYQLVGVIRGLKWNDADGSGVPEPGEIGLSNWTINVFNSTYFNSTVTNAFGTGEYEIWVPYGSYTVNETQNTSWSQTAPPGNTYSITINDAQWVYENINFGNQKLPSSTISGYKFQDVYGNGTYLIPLENWTITLTNITTEAVFGSTSTAGNGYFSFTQVPNGTYYLNETLQYGWRNTSAVSYAVAISSDGEELVRNFTNEQYLANITGVKFNDGNHDGNYDEDQEPLIPGWNISLYYQNGTYISSQFTDTTGAYHFGGLDKSEEYIIQEDQHTGWVGTTPDTVDVDFANLSICPGTFHISDDALLLARMPNSRLIFVPESRIGSNSLSGDYEIDIHYIDPVFTVPVTAQKTWSSGTDYNFNMTYDPLTELVTYTVDGTSISMAAHHPLTQPFAFSDFAIRTRATNDGSQIDIYNLSLSVQGVPVPIQQTAFGETNTSRAYGPSPPGDLDILWIRANYLAQRVDPSLDVMNGFTLSGTQRMTWTPGNMPQGSQLAYQIKVGKPICPLDTNRFVVFGNYQYNNVSGFKNEDPIGDGTNGTPLSGWNINIWYENGTKMSETTTDGFGYYSFQNLTFGNYTINETPQDGWTLTYPPGGNYQVFIDASSLEFINLNFTNHQAALFGNISGYKFNTLGSGLENWLITLTNVTNGSVATSTTTGLNGGFLFENIPVGLYYLNETLQSGWQQVSPPAGYVVNITGEEHVFQGLNFTNARLGNVSGFKLNGTLAGQPGWTITLTNTTTMAITNTSITDSQGFFIIESIPQGTYYLNETLQSGWQRISPAEGYVITVDDSTYQYQNRNFTNTRLGNINGMKYNDLNGNGIRDLNDNPLSGWTIRLFYQGNNSLYASSTTDSNGNFVFNNVPLGLYILNETQQSGWTQTAPPGGSYSIEINGTTWSVSGKDFGNQQAVNPCSCPTSAYFTHSQVKSPLHTIKFTDGSVGNPVYWYWIFGDGTTSLTRSPTKTYSKAGTYTVKLYVKGCDCSGKTYWTIYGKSVKVA